MTSYQTVRKELKKDAFIDFFKALVGNLQHNREKFVVFLLSCVAFLIVFVVLKSHNAKRVEVSYQEFNSVMANASTEDLDSGKQTALLSIVKRYPKLDAGIQSLFILLDYYYRTEKYEDGLRVSKMVIKNYSNMDLVYGKLVLFQAYCYEQSGEYGYAIRALKAFVDQKPNSSSIVEARLSLARCYALKGSAVEARDTYARIIKDFPSTVWSQRAQDALDQIE